MSAATPDKPDAAGRPSGWKLELFGGPMDGYQLGASPQMVAEIIARGFVKVRVPHGVTERGEKHYLYTKADDGKFRFTKELFDNDR